MKLAFAESGLVPECQFYAIVRTHLVIDDSEIIAYDLLRDLSSLPL